MGGTTWFVLSVVGTTYFFSRYPSSPAIERSAINQVMHRENRKKNATIPDIIAILYEWEAPLNFLHHQRIKDHFP